MQEFLLSLRRKAKEDQKEFKKSEKEACEKMKGYLLASKGEDSSEIQRVKALIGIEHLYESGDRRTSDLILSNDLRVLAEYVHVHELLIERIDRELEESGIREMVKDIKTIKELVEVIRKLKEQAKTEAKKARESEKEMKANLSYIS